MFKRFKSFLLRFLLSVTTVLTVFFIFEIYFRIFPAYETYFPRNAFKSSDYSDYKHTPSNDFSFKTSDFDFDVRINQYGLRGGEYSLSKDEGTYRIFSLGDSMAFGYGAFEFFYRQ